MPHDGWTRAATDWHARAAGAQVGTTHTRLRCNALSGSDKADCLARMAGHDTVSGSVEGGGLLRDLTTYGVGAGPASPAPPASAPPK